MEIQTSNVWRGGTDVENVPHLNTRLSLAESSKSVYLAACLYTTVSSWTDLQLIPGILSEKPLQEVSLTTYQPATDLTVEYLAYTPVMLVHNMLCVCVLTIVLNKFCHFLNAELDQR